MMLQAHPVADLFPMMSDTEYADLLADVREHGLREAIWVHRDGRIIDGRNRHRACTEAGIAATCRTYEGDDGGLVAFVISLNLKRRHLNETQRAGVGARIENMTHGGSRAREQDANLHLEIGLGLANVPAVPRAEAARLLNVSTRSVASAHKVIDRGVPELIDKMDRGEIAVSTAAVIAEAPEDVQRKALAEHDRKAIGEVAKELKQAKQLVARVREPEAVQEPIAPPDGKYQCIVIDPPWPMKKIEREERPDQGVELDYPVMTLEEIADDALVPVRTLAADDCHLYLWVTHKFLPAGLELLDTWGFRYQCVMTWRKNVGITPFSWMYDTEHVLFGRRGNLPLDRLGLRLSFDAPVKGHSVKPDVFYERVVQASPGPRVDMFARRPRTGFTVWGNEVADLIDGEVRDVV